MRRLLVVDSNVTFASPSMRCWLAASDGFMDKFDEIEVWGQACELTGRKVKFVPIKGQKILGPFWYLYFLLEVRKRFKKLTPGYLAETLIQCTGCMVPFADVRFIHFWDTAFLELARKRKDCIKLNSKDHVFRNIAVRQEQQALRDGATGAWWCVSRGIAEPIIHSDRSGAPLDYLPNSFDAQRFNPRARIRWRKEMRAHYGFDQEEIVFGFSSFGHFERKGLRQAVEAVNQLNERGFKVRLLVIGGRSRTIEQFKRSLLSGRIQTRHLIFAGMVTEMEKHLSVADALFFPSHFEAFSLVEIEAAALGIRLYLTPHPGHEMILRENVNGRLLPWDVPGMVDVLGDEIKSGAILNFHEEIGEALTPDCYKEQLEQLFQESIERKWGNIELSE